MCPRISLGTFCNDVRLMEMDWSYEMGFGYGLFPTLIVDR